MAAFHSPQGSFCAKCGNALDPAALICPNCKLFTHASELEEIAVQARQLAAMGQLPAARDRWLAALNMLPPESNQYQAVLREVEKLNRRINPPPQGQTASWTKRLGPAGAAIAGLAKFKGLLLGLAHYKALFSLIAFFGVYWAMFGWWFAVGMVASVALHEMGHYVAARRFGFAADLPMFIPGMGAYVKWQGANVEPAIRAQISLAGPFFGLISGLIAYAVFVSTHQGVWLAVAHFAAWLNLLNLIPVFIFDGGSAMIALGRPQRIAIVVVSVVMFLLLHNFLYLAIAAGAAYRVWKKDFPAQPSHVIAYFFTGLIIVLGLFNWFVETQARFAFGR